MTRQPFGRRCSPVSVAVLVSVCVLMIGVGSAQAGSGPVAANGVTAAVRPVQPAVSGLFQVHAPRIWADSFDESGSPRANGVPDFLDSWQAFTARQDGAILKNGYAFRSIDELGHQILYAGVQRAASGGPSKVVIELSQKPGERVAGDLRIEALIDASGSLGKVLFQSHAEGRGNGKLIELAILSGEGCNDAGTACIVANGALLEVGVNLSQLLGDIGDRFKGIQIGTPEGSVVGTFSLAGAGANTTNDCVKEQGPLNNPVCTANDVMLTEIVPLTTNVISDDCTFTNGVLGGTVTFSATGRFVLTTQTRYDIGLYIDTAGDPEPAFKPGVADGARSGNCTRFAFSNSEGVNAESPADSCGDLTQAIASAPTGRTMTFGPVTVACVDKDSDDNIDVFHCETWSQNEDEINCTGSGSVEAGTASKCNCGIVQGLCVPTPSTDPCVENVCEAHCGGTASGATCTSNADCAAGVTCREIVVQRVAPNGTACGDSTDGACDDPDTCVDGECSDNTSASTTICRAAADVCDLAESCDGTSAACPADAKAPAGTACGSNSDTVCDDPDTCDGSGVCEENNAPDTTTCREAANGCDAAESCENGVCPPDVCRDDLPPDPFPPTP
jgi:hypothetical protein